MPIVYVTKIVVIVLAKDLQIHCRSSSFGNNTNENLFAIKFYFLISTDQDSGLRAQLHSKTQLKYKYTSTKNSNSRSREKKGKRMYMQEGGYNRQNISLYV